MKIRNTLLVSAGAAACAALLAISAPAPAHESKPQAKSSKQGAKPQARNPFAGSAAAVRDGHNLFMANNCYGCHSPGGGGGMGPPLIDAKWEHGGKPRDIYKSIAEGHPDHGMPPFGKRLRDDEIWKLVTYVESLGAAR